MRHVLSLWLIILSLCSLSVEGATNFIRNFGSKKLLLYWAVDSDERTIETVKKNVEHARAVAGPDCCEVMLAHYAHGASEESVKNHWGAEWHDREVSKYSFGEGFKFYHLKRMYVNEWHSKFDFVWALDSDIDFTRLDILSFLQLARQSTSLVVGPTFIGADPRHDDSDMAFLNATFDEKVATSLVNLDATGENAQAYSKTLLHRIHTLGEQDLRCQMRHTDFVELTAPLLKIDVLLLLLSECQECIQPNSDWGLDMIWCKMATERFGNDRACALLDATPVTHLDWKTARVTSNFFGAYQAVHKRFPRYWAQVENKDCLNPRGNSWIDALGQVVKLVPIKSYR